jgi:hypothetical protein
MIEILLSVHVESSGVSVFWFQRSRVPGCPCPVPKGWSAGSSVCKRYAAWPTRNRLPGVWLGSHLGSILKACNSGNGME